MLPLLLLLALWSEFGLSKLYSPGRSLRKSVAFIAAVCRGQVAVPAGRTIVVGAGALGSELCRGLMQARINDVLVVDPDVLQTANVQLSRFYRRAQQTEEEEVLGRAKAEIVVEQASACGLRWRAQVCEIADLGLGRLQNSTSLLLSATDSALARTQTAFSARRLGIPMIDGGVFGEGTFGGRATYFSAEEDAACYLCGLREGRRAEVLTRAASASLGCSVLPERVGSLSDTTNAANTEQSTRAVAKYMLRLCHEVWSGAGARDSRAELLAGTAQECRFDSVRLRRAADCPLHDLPAVNDWFPLPRDLPFAVALAEQPGTALLLEWPICLRARCTECGAGQEPLCRVARIHQGRPCAVCGRSGSLEPLEVCEAIEPGPLAQRSPRSLGLPAHHLFVRVRQPFGEG